MSKESTWRRHYHVHRDGRAFITGAQLRAIEATAPVRILDLDLRGAPERVLLLDKPFRLGDKVDGTDGAFHLLRVRLRDLPGWPPRLAAPGGAKPPPLAECRLVAARVKGTYLAGQGGLECELAHEGKVFTAWLVGCPLPLMMCTLKTFNEPGVFGSLVGDLQDVRLVGDSKGG